MEAKSKSHLVLMEQSVMILVFAFAAALCVMAFQKADAMSKAMANRDRAVNVCQTVAETAKALQGDLEAVATELQAEVKENKLFLWYGEDWTQATEPDAVYGLCMTCTGTTEFLEKYNISVTNTETKEELFCLPVSMQREVPHE